MSSLPFLQSSSTARLPNELLLLIIELLGSDRPTLSVVARCNSFFRKEAEHKIYARLDESTASSTVLHTKFLATVAQNSYLASLVREYHCVDIVGYLEAPLWSLLYTALRCMNGLEVLRFRTIQGHPAAALLVEVPFKLKKLHWANLPEGEMMASVLEQQTRLKYLHLDVHPGTTLPPKCCLNLEELSGTRGTLDALLPARHIKAITWAPNSLDDDFEGKSIRHILAAAFRRLKTLSFGGYFARPNLKLVVNYLDQLENLELVNILEGELALLQCLPSLRELVFSFQWGSHQISISREADQRRRLVKKLFSECQNLRRADIAYEWTDISEIWYQRWTRETMLDPPTMVSIGLKYCWFGGRRW